MSPGQKGLSVTPALCSREGSPREGSRCLCGDLVSLPSCCDSLGSLLGYCGPLAGLPHLPFQPAPRLPLHSNPLSICHHHRHLHHLSSPAYALLTWLCSGARCSHPCPDSFLDQAQISPPLKLSLTMQPNALSFSSEVQHPLLTGHVVLDR